MKNIHVLPTDKPSRLCKDENNRIWLSINFEYGINDNNKQNIYITTSDEEIKEGDWYIFPLYKKGFSIKRYNSVEHFSKEPCISLANLKAKKIILTTDQDLIKDGVQAIDDEFLEWFVKNPSCEEVEVNNLCYGYLGGFADAGYKIIIPKEEAKQDRTCNNNCSVVCGECQVFEPKQETLEEAAREYYKRGQLGFEKAADTEMAFLRGAKWQQERMYSEKEVLSILYKFTEDLLSGQKITLEEWFEQFKNK